MARSELSNLSNAHGLRIGLVVSDYHSSITHPLRDGAAAAFREAGGRDGDLLVVPAPGAFELTAICRALVHRGDLHAVVALGCIMTGETTHDQHIATAVAHGLTSITVETGIPVCFGVLTCQTMDQARARAGGDVGNKGVEAMAAAISVSRTVEAVSVDGMEASS